MPSLEDTQRCVREAVVSGNLAAAAGLIAGRPGNLARLAIHHRHYETSLSTALVGKFPATGWLVGATFITQAAEAFVRASPPRVLCIAEYGDTFPDFLATMPGAERTPYLLPFMQLEWRVGQVALAIDRPAVGVGVLAALTEDAVADASVALQPGLHYLYARWPVDRLMQFFLTDSAPDQLTLDPEDVWLELRGTRGAFQMQRLEASDFIFRQALQQGAALADAAALAMDRPSGTFDASRALGLLFAEGLCAGITSAPQTKETT